jgi:hypothetical protein
MPDLNLTSIHFSQVRRWRAFTYQRHAQRIDRLQREFPVHRFAAGVENRQAEFL